MTSVARFSLYFFLLFLFIACTSVSDPYSLQGEAYGTTWQIKFFEDQNVIDKEELEIKVKEELMRICLLYTSDAADDQ